MKVSKRLLAGGVVCCMLGMGFVQTATAEDAPAKKLYIKKVLTVADGGVTTPSATLNLNSKNRLFNGKPDSGSVMPDLTAGPSNTVSYSDADATDKDSRKADKQVVKATGNIFQGATFNHSGDYVYKVTEETTGTACDPRTNGQNGEKYECSKAEYELSFRALGGKITDINIKKTKNNDGTPIGDPQKTPYTPGAGDPSSGGAGMPDGTGADNNFVFENSYIKTANPVTDDDTTPSGYTKNDPGKDHYNDPTDTELKGLVLSKKVVGSDAAKANKFPFTFTVTKPSYITENTKFKYYIVNRDNTVQDPSKYLEGAYNIPHAFGLKDGERVVVKNVYYGSKVTAQETNNANMTVGVKAVGTTVLNDETQVKDNGIVLSDATNRDGVAAGDKHNQIAFTNTEQALVGVLMDMFPIIALVLVSALGFAYVLRSRKAREM